LAMQNLLAARGGCSLGANRILLYANCILLYANCILLYYLGYLPELLGDTSRNEKLRMPMLHVFEAVHTKAGF